MFRFLPAMIRGTMIFVLVWINIILHCIPLYIFALFRFLSPASFKPVLSRGVNKVAESWISTNNFIFDQFQHMEINILEMPDLNYDNWYLVVSNHQTWMDIVILQRIFNRRIPLLKFFIKQELIWIPLIGIAWWALDFPIMKRYSREQLIKKPHLRGKDLKTTLESCEKFKLTPVSVLNFLEGTRFTIDKHRTQKSPFNNLLRPKAGGAAMVIDSLNDRLKGLLDVTIVYPDGVRSMWEFLCAPHNRVLIQAKLISLSETLNNQKGDDTGNKPSLKEFVNQLWESKDTRIEHLKQADVDQQPV